MDGIDIQKGQKWKEKMGKNIVKILRVSSIEVRAKDINGDDRGTEMRMKPYDFLRKYKPLN